MRYSRSKTQYGFSLIELLISMTVGLVIIAALSSTFLIQRDAYRIQDQIAEATQTTRVALDMLAREIRTAGFDPTKAGFDGIIYSSSELRILADLNGDGMTDDENEDITYKYDSESRQIKRKTNNGYFQPFAENVQAFTFEYLDGDGNAAKTTEAIRQMRISVTTRTEKPDPDYPQNNGYRIITLTSHIIPHNLNMQKWF